ncbi:bifunctional 3-(3-hydroxy-phenyl)propionate/3-hydroxycinnamic acid hydroxylase [Rhizobium leguminosarum]|uniref:bifunctional 3-(3-hydroxy-phenyl)propionate/3-hydroxycinnamic acid hydroxylase n=1 Tax=Rhizobium leguminosarum TaxID=384 RepID=UPI0024A8FFA8|nr:bifunctional 3-(3-hydroxy-phenyl)propionate/3-hydroxycinnamic acid hydroxylase [Rhizobium leguminosarum]MDI5929704.1 bifunctional 3-(3-hydroxy-phenyl)propionate/3-hydroxycinnamic acid hydroxylase [Rhizobium leguminosarum]
MMAHLPDETDVLVVGAGPTGLLLSNLLGSMGVGTTLVDRNGTTVREPRAVSIDDESLRALQAAGLADTLAAITVKGYGSLYLGPDGRRFAEVKPHVKEYGFDKRNAFEQPVFEATLREALERHPHVASCFGVELEGFSQNSDYVFAEISSGTQTRQLRARYMVAADGGRSMVRKALDIPLEGSTFQEPWLIVDLQSTRNRCFHTEVFCDPRRSAITLPGPGGIRRYEFKLNPGESTEEAEQESFARRLLTEIGPDGEEPIRRQKVYTFHARVAARWRQGRIFLAGDAAHLTPPFAGQGMNSGLRDAHNLAWKLDEALHMAHPDALLDSYEAERKPHAWSMIELALRMGKIMMPASVQRGRLIRAGFRALGLYGPARDYFAQMKYKPKPKFSAGLIRPAPNVLGAAAIGRMIPQPVVTTLDRQQVLLDTLLPDTPVVLVFSETPDRWVDPKIQAQLQALGCAVIGLTPEWINPVFAGFQMIRDHSRFFSQRPFSECLDKALLLRRDRYVAAIEPVQSIAGLIPMITRLTEPSANRQKQPPVNAAELRLKAI